MVTVTVLLGLIAVLRLDLITAELISNMVLGAQIGAVEFVSLIRDRKVAASVRMTIFFIICYDFI
jgi:hypothetical protein